MSTIQRPDVSAVTSSIIDMIERATLCDTAPVSVGAITADTVIPVADERPNGPETPYKFHEPPVGLMGDYDRHGGRIVGRDRYGALVERRTLPCPSEPCSVFSVEPNVHQIATVFRGVVTSISRRCVSRPSISSTGYFATNVLSAASWLLGCGT